MTGGLLPFAALRVIRELTSRCLMSCGPYFTFRRKRVTKRLLLFPTPFWKTTIAYPCRTTQVVVAEAHPVRPSAAAAGMTARASILVLIDLATSLIAPEDGASQRRSLAERSCSYPLPANSMRRRRTVLGRRVRAKGRVEPGRRPAGPGARTRSLHDRGLVAGPVRLPQHPLVQLAGGGPRHVGHEVDGPRALEVRDPGPAVLDQLAGQVGPGAGQVGGLHHGLHLLAQVLVGDADHGHVEHGGMRGEQVLRLLGVDVDAARDDHVALAVGGYRYPSASTWPTSPTVMATSSTVLEAPPPVRPSAVLTGSAKYANAVAPRNQIVPSAQAGHSFPSSSRMSSSPSTGRPTV